MTVFAISSEMGQAAQPAAQQADRGSAKSGAAAKGDEARRQELAALTKAKPEATANTAQNPHPVINGLGLGVEFSTDRETGEVIRQLPPKELVAFLRQFQKNDELSAGLLLSLWS
ncbi:MAG: flagellar protein FlaG [Deltaproteobacteria bacterium]|nr:flagellar protein FlaG [Deltaproteobacteria bacterium]MDZ4342515.1 flagellar protein FlaG [Candidatus Binatia bacterium]